MKYSYLLILLVINTLTLQAQSPMSDVYLKSPNMASLGEYGEVPVSLYTGTVQVKVPLFTLNTGNHSMDVYLSYHGGGVRPDSHPGWVGLGWTLFAGGSITRVVGGLPDECDNYQVELNDIRGTYFGPKRGLLYGKYGDFSTTSNSPSANKNLFFPYSITPGFPLVYPAWDVEPDKFMFNFMGYSGTFFYTSDQGWVVECDKPLKVVFDKNNPDNFSRTFHDVYDMNSNQETCVHDSRSVSINNFLIIDEYGNKYYFGGKDKQEAIEYSVGYFNQHNSEITSTAWHLTKIEYADGRNVQFNYEKKDYIVEMGLSDTYCIFMYEVRDYNLNLHHFKQGEMYNGVFLSTKNDAYFSDKSRDFADGSLIAPSYLSSIKYGDCQVDFITKESNELQYPMKAICEMHFKPSKVNDWEHLVYLQQICANATDRQSTKGNAANDRLKWHKLKEIRVSNNKGKELRTFIFNYNDEKIENQAKVRLCLEQVEEIGFGKYNFEYDRPEELPDYCSYNLDHWGFYKETGIATRYISEYGQHSVDRRGGNITEGQYPNYRNPDASKGTIGSLMKISYPTGGYTRFEYEPHDYQYEVKSDKTGLQKRRMPWEAGGIRVKKIYNSSSSETTDEYLQKQYVYRDIIHDSNNFSSGILLHPVRYSYKSDAKDKNQVREMYNAQGIRPMGLSSDGCHVAYSSVSEIANDGATTVYYFTDYHQYPDKLLEDNPQTGRFQYIIPACSMASIRGQLRLKQHYTSDGVLTESIGYEYSPDYATIIETTKLVSTPSETGVIYDIYPVSIFTKVNLPILIQDTTFYANGKSKIKSTSIEYTQYGRMASSILHKYSDNYSFSTKYTYPFENIAENQTLAMMTNANMFGYPVNINKIVGVNGNSYFQENVSYTYDTNLSGLPIEIAQQTVENSPPSSTAFTYGIGGNITTQTDNDSNDTTVYIWGYNNEHIVAMIQHTTLSAVRRYIKDLEAFAQTDIPDFEKLDMLRMKLQYADMYTYKYILGVGISECIMPDGQVVKYNYDNTGRLSHITDEYGNIIEFYDYNTISNN